MAAPVIQLFAQDRATFERQPDEKDDEWKYFLYFRDLESTRTQQKIAKRFGIRQEQISRISTKWSWKTRIVDWDNHRDAKAREEHIEQAKRQAKELAELAENMWSLAAKDLKRWHTKLENASHDEPILTPRDIEKLADSGLKIHRLLHGDPTQITKKEVAMSAKDQREQLRELLGDEDAMRVVEKMRSGGTKK